MVRRRRSIGTLAILVAVLAVSLFSCSRGPDEVPIEAEAETSGKGADLLIALLPERNVFDQKKKYLPLQEYLSKKLEFRVYFKLLDNYETIFAELIDGKVDGAFWGSMNGAIAQERGGVEMLARPVWADGVSTYLGYVFTRKGTEITADPRTWKGRTFAFVNEATTAGFLYPLSMMRSAGIEEEPADYFRRTIFAGSHDAVIRAVFQGEIEIGAAKNTIFEEYVKQHPEVGERLTILSESKNVPSNALGVSPTLPATIKQNLKETLLAMKDDPEGREVLENFGALDFVETTRAHYEPVEKMAEAAGIELSSWPLRKAGGARPYR